MKPGFAARSTCSKRSLHIKRPISLLSCALHLGEDASQLVLGLDKRGLVRVGRPLASPLPSDGVKGHVRRYLRHRRGGRRSNQLRALRVFTTGPVQVACGRLRRTPQQKREGDAISLRAPSMQRVARLMSAVANRSCAAAVSTVRALPCPA